MAESVDALVSNTSGAIRAGSIPALGTTRIANSFVLSLLAIFDFVFLPKLCPHILLLFSDICVTLPLRVLCINLCNYHFPDNFPTPQIMCYALKIFWAQSFVIMPKNKTNMTLSKLILRYT